jgi:hypothetical protein
MNLANHVFSLGCSNCSRPTSLCDPINHGVSCPSRPWCVGGDDDDGNADEMVVINADDAEYPIVASVASVTQPCG